MSTLLSVWRLLTIMLTALSLGPAFAHLLELPAKVTFDGALWLELLHALYPPAFGTPGALFEVSAVVTAIGLTILVCQCQRRPAFVWTLVGTLFLAASYAAFWVWVAPVNEAMALLTPETLPANWMDLRNQWEYTHAARAGLQLIGLGALVFSVLVEIPSELPTQSDGSNKPFLGPMRTGALVGYSIVLAILSAGSLICLVAEIFPMGSKLLMLLITVMVAGIFGSILCNLSGLFTQLADLENSGKFPSRLEIPFYIRPATGLVTGLLTFFVGNLLVASLAVNPATASWENLAGRLPFIAIAILAGFAAQEFIERLKETAQTLFSESAEAARYINLEALSPLLDKLADLKQRSLLSDEEFANFKAAIFGRISRR
jgi:hypothetical protein